MVGNAGNAQFTTCDTDDSTHCKAFILYLLRSFRLMYSTRYVSKMSSLTVPSMAISGRVLQLEKFIDVFYLLRSFRVSMVLRVSFLAHPIGNTSNTRSYFGCSHSGVCVLGNQRNCNGRVTSVTKLVLPPTPLYWVASSSC